MSISTPMSNIFAASILYSLMMSVSSCKLSHLRDIVIGFGCAWDNQVNSTGVAEHECVLLCMLDKSCAAVNYDVQDRVCMQMEVPCTVLETHQNTHYQILAPPPMDGCTQWTVSSDWNYPRMVKYNRKHNGYKLDGVARLNMAGEVLPARWPEGYLKAFTIQNNIRFGDTAFEVLLVKESCSLSWVYYNASSGNAMPPGAIMGGHLADGTQLYVAIAYMTDTVNLLGFYNQRTRMGAYYHNGVQNTQGGMKILTAQENLPISNYNKQRWR